MKDKVQCKSFGFNTNNTGFVTTHALRYTKIDSNREEVLSDQAQPHVTKTLGYSPTFKCISCHDFLKQATSRTYS